MLVSVSFQKPRKIIVVTPSLEICGILQMSNGLFQNLQGNQEGLQQCGITLSLKLTLQNLGGSGSAYVTRIFPLLLNELLREFMNKQLSCIQLYPSINCSKANLFLLSSFYFSIQTSFCFFFNCLFYYTILTKYDLKRYHNQFQKKKNLIIQNTKIYWVFPPSASLFS